MTSLSTFSTSGKKIWSRRRATRVQSGHDDGRRRSNPRSSTRALRVPSLAPRRGLREDLLLLPIPKAERLAGFESRLKSRLLSLAQVIRDVRNDPGRYTLGRVLEPFEYHLLLRVEVSEKTSSSSRSRKHCRRRLLDTCRGMAERLAGFESRLKSRLLSLAQVIRDVRNDPGGMVRGGCVDRLLERREEVGQLYRIQGRLSQQEDKLLDTCRGMAERLAGFESRLKSRLLSLAQVIRDLLRVEVSEKTSSSSRSRKHCRRRLRPSSCPD
jgi:hypothetical protein